MECSQGRSDCGTRTRASSSGRKLISLLTYTLYGSLGSDVSVILKVTLEDILLTHEGIAADGARERRRVRTFDTSGCFISSQLTITSAVAGVKFNQISESPARENDGDSSRVSCGYSNASIDRLRNR